MAVRKGDQEQGKLTAIDASRLLISYTYDRVHDKTLPKTDRWLMAKTIWDDASKARQYIVIANSIKVENREEAEDRIFKEKLAIGHLDSLAASLDVLHIKGIISDDRMDYWSKLVYDTQNLTKGLMKANKTAYKRFLKEDNNQREQTT